MQCITYSNNIKNFIKNITPSLTTQILEVKPIPGNRMSHLFAIIVELLDTLPNIVTNLKNTTTSLVEKWKSV
jgi:hypothetical protein